MHRSITLETKNRDHHFHIFPVLHTQCEGIQHKIEDGQGNWAPLGLHWPTVSLKSHVLMWPSGVQQVPGIWGFKLFVPGDSNHACPFRHTAFSQSRERLHNALFFGNTGSSCSFVQCNTVMTVQIGSLYSLVVSWHVPYEEKKKKTLAKWPHEYGSQGKTFRHKHWKLLMNQRQGQFSHPFLPVGSSCRWLCYKILWKAGAETQPLLVKLVSEGK